MKMITTIYFCSLILGNAIYAQDTIDKVSQQALNFHILNVENGLSSNVINDIVQDSLGFIWIATEDGLNRYDGSQFLKFRENTSANEYQIANNSVQRLAFKNPEELLIGTDGGLNIYNTRTGKMKLISQKDGLINNSISSISLTSWGATIVGTYRGGLQLLDKNFRFQKKHIDYSSMTSTEISSSLLQRDSILWVGTFNKGLNKIDLKSGKVVKKYQAGNSFLNSSIINCLYQDDHENLWIGTRAGISVITNAGKKITLTGSLSDNDVLSFQEDKKGNIWVGTRNGGLNILNKASFFKDPNQAIIRKFLPATDGTSVWNRSIHKMKMDHHGKVWIGTSTGLNYVNPAGEIVHTLQQKKQSENSLIHNRIGTLANASNGNIWIGTDGGGLDLYHPASKKFTHLTHIENNTKSLSNDYILSILEDKQDRVWVGTYLGGLNRLDKKSGNFKHYLEGKPGDGSDVRAIFQSSNGHIWVGTNQGGLYLYNEQEDKFNYIEKLGKIDIRAIEEDKLGNLWLGTFGTGIIKYDPRTNSSEFFNSSNIEGMTSNIVFAIHPISENTIMVGTRYGGLILLNPESKKITVYTEEDGLSNNTITDIVQENKEYIWLSTYKGINRFSLENKEILDISSLNNIQKGGFGVGCLLMSKAGTIYAGGINGVNYFDPKTFSKKTKSYPLILKDLIVLNKKVLVNDDEDAILTASLPYRSSITLDHSENTFSVNFAVLKFPQANNIEYLYKLKGYNEFWIKTQGIGSANFTNVPPGKYELEIKTDSPYRANTSKILAITILPPFWATFPAYILYVLIFGLILCIIGKYYSDRLKLNNSLIFEKKQRKLEHDLNEERLRFFTAFSHELKTPLTLIMAPVESLLGKVHKQETIENLSFIKRNAQILYGRIDRLLEFRKAEEGLSQLVVGQHDLEKNIRQWTKNYKPLAKDKKIKLSLSILTPLEKFNCDLGKLEIIYNNLLSNAIKYSKWQGKVTIEVFTKNEMLKIKVSNQGIGIKQEDINQIFDWYYRADNSLRKKGSGIGLALSKRFAELHLGNIKVKSESNGTTQFTLSIPINLSTTILDTGNEEKDLENILAKESLTRITIKDKKEKQLAGKKGKEIVLIIDDNPEILTYLDSILKDEFDLIHSRDGEDGVKKALKYVPDLIISDVMMPKLNGIQLCNQLKQHHITSHVPIILLTAKSNTESISSGFAEGADDYITKPFHPNLLKTRIKALLENRKKLQEFLLKGNPEFQKNTFSENTSGIIDSEKKFLLKTEALILNGCPEVKVNTDYLVKELGMSRTSLYRKIKAITGQNINEFIRDTKLKKAAKLIYQEEYSVTEASFEVGFSSIKYFRKVFKEKYGYNPSEFKTGAGQL
ncbi:hybrid sensor histidine kinase/response regulator transcription factor [Zunongwangia pacifica]|uniref:histidine kinase n=1 Tax=Zunongwangia pacifica TaxID=2911062 RepID=A0A9X1ZV92_9FLAO|nr:two-component regulator propeller domain-containing protein [Zunongwangia pacifica]MCL6217001.1 response regulator [Zunongwangia pacifica]